MARDKPCCPRCRCEKRPAGQPPERLVLDLVGPRSGSCGWICRLELLDLGFLFKPKGFESFFLWKKERCPVELVIWSFVFLLETRWLLLAVGAILKGFFFVHLLWQWKERDLWWLKSSSAQSSVLEEDEKHLEPSECGPQEGLPSCCLIEKLLETTTKGFSLGCWRFLSI